MKLSDFLKQQGDTPQGKNTYQAFIDNWEPSRLDVWADNKGNEISAAFFWADTPEGIYFWDNISENRKKTLEFESENDMLWLLDGKEPPSEQKEYPRWFKSTETETIVQFDSLQSGKVIGGSVALADGYYTTIWKPHTDASVWQEVPNPRLAQEKRTPLDDNEIDKLLDEVNNIDDKNHLDAILAERAAKYGSYKAQAKCVGDIILAAQEVAKANGKQQTAEQIGSIAYLAIKIARYANGETGDTLDDLEGYIKLIREMEQKDE